MGDTDADLVEASRDGDTQAFGRLVERYKSLVFAVSVAATRDPSRAEDVAQEAFLSAWRGLPTLADPGKLRPWLCGIARNVASKSHRRRRRDGPTMNEPPEPKDHTSPLDALVNRETQEQVWAALDAMPQTYREPLVLFYQEERPVQDVATALGLSNDTVRQRLTRGRRILKDGIGIESFGDALRHAAPSGAFTAAVLASLGAAPAVASAASTIAVSKGVIMASTSTKAIIVGVALAATAGGVAWASVDDDPPPEGLPMAAQVHASAAESLPARPAAPQGVAQNHQREIEQLRDHVGELEAELHAARAAAGDDDSAVEAFTGVPVSNSSFFAPSEDELRELAKTCTLRYDKPHLEADAAKLPVTGLDVDAEAVESIHAAFRTEYAAQLRELYVEATGDAEGASNLSTSTLADELEKKSVPEDVTEVHWRLSQERGGLLDAPSDVADAPPFARWLRLQLELGDVLEQRLAQEIGADAAHKIRGANDGFGSKSQWGGCNDREPLVP